MTRLQRSMSELVEWKTLLDYGVPIAMAIETLGFLWLLEL